MSKKRSKLEGGMAVPLILPEDMRNRVRDLSTKSRLSDADIMRMSIDRGLKLVEKMFADPGEKAAA